MRFGNPEQRVREQIAIAIEDDLRGGELLMKEVWEDCETDEDEERAKAEMRRILELLK